MAKIHEKSPCCKGRMVRFGGRRRQCANCKKTWSAWPRKRGRHRLRTQSSLLDKYFDGAFASIQKEADRRGIHESVLRRRMRFLAQRLCNKGIWPSPTFGSTILLADAIVKRLDGCWWTIYLTSVKSVAESFATLLPPIVSHTRESHKGWQDALNGISDEIYRNIAVIVCDGHRGIVDYARGTGRRIQRCQAHLLFALQGRRSLSRWSRHRKEGERIYQLAKDIMTTTDKVAIKNLIDELETLGWQTRSTQLRKIINGFLGSVNDYRTCLEPEYLAIPATNNAMESFIGLFQELCHKARGFSSPEALKLWATAFAKHKNRITCNGINQQNKCR